METPTHWIRKHSISSSKCFRHRSLLLNIDDIPTPSKWLHNWTGVSYLMPVTEIFVRERIAPMSINPTNTISIWKLEVNWTGIKWRTDFSQRRMRWESLWTMSTMRPFRQNTQKMASVIGICSRVMQPSSVFLQPLSLEHRGELFWMRCEYQACGCGLKRQLRSLLLTAPEHEED